MKSISLFLKKICPYGYMDSWIKLMRHHYQIANNINVNTSYSNLITNIQKRHEKILIPVRISMF